MSLRLAIGRAPTRTTGARRLEHPTDVPKSPESQLYPTRQRRRGTTSFEGCATAGLSNWARASCSQDTGSSPQLPPVMGEKPLATSRILLKICRTTVDVRPARCLRII